MHTHTHTKKSAIDPKLIVPFVNSVRSVLATMAGFETTVQRPRVKTSPAPDYDYSGIIGFSGTIVGTVVVSFHRETAIKLVAAFAGGHVEPDTSDFADAVGELANMIAGAAKKDLGGAANITVPSVVMGKGHTISRPSDIPCLMVPCITSAGEFAIEVSIKSV
jgi:chemotaxis protein CheX